MEGREPAERLRPPPSSPRGGADGFSSVLSLSVRAHGDVDEADPTASGGSLVALGTTVRHVQSKSEEVECEVQWPALLVEGQSDCLPYCYRIWEATRPYAKREEGLCRELQGSLRQQGWRPRGFRRRDRFMDPVWEILIKNIPQSHVPMYNQKLREIFRQLEPDKLHKYDFVINNLKAAGNLYDAFNNGGKALEMRVDEDQAIAALGDAIHVSLKTESYPESMNKGVRWCKSILDQLTVRRELDRATAQAVNALEGAGAPEEAFVRLVEAIDVAETSPLQTAKHGGGVFDNELSQAKSQREKLLEGKKASFKLAVAKGEEAKKGHVSADDAIIALEPEIQSAEKFYPFVRDVARRANEVQSELVYEARKDIEKILAAATAALTPVSTDLSADEGIKNLPTAIDRCQRLAPHFDAELKKFQKLLAGVEAAKNLWRAQKRGQEVLEEKRNGDEQTSYPIPRATKELKLAVVRARVLPESWDDVIDDAKTLGANLASEGGGASQAAWAYDPEALEEEAEQGGGGGRGGGGRGGGGGGAARPSRAIVVWLGVFASCWSPPMARDCF